jgi:hypothetical protein
LVLGEKLWEEKGKMTGVSVKSVGSEGVHMEETFASEFKGIGRFPSGRNMGTINIVVRPDGHSSGKAQGICTTQNGDMMVWKLFGLSKPEAGKDKSVAIIQLMTTSQKLSWMNGLLVVYESIGDMKTMEFSGTGYEWK